MTRRKLSARPEFRDDIRRLPTANLQRRALQILADVAGGQNLGEQLEDHSSVGDLSDCRKVYFDETDERKPRYRLVYRLLPDEVTAVEVEAIVVGLRAAMQVYVDAARRLGRFVDDPGTAGDE